MRVDPLQSTLCCALLALAPTLAGAGWPAHEADLLAAVGAFDDTALHGYDEATEVTSVLTPSGLAHPGPMGELVVSKGHYTWNLPPAPTGSTGLTIQLYALPDTLSAPGTVLLAEFGGLDISLSQNGPLLSLVMNTAAPGATESTAILLGTLPVDTPAHLAFTIDQNNVAFYRDGHEHLKAPLPDDFALPGPPQRLLLGAGHNGKPDWRGRVESIALHTRPLSASEITDAFAAWKKRAAARDNSARLTVRAMLQSRPPAFSDHQQPEADRALAVFAYRIQGIIEGEYEHDILYVVHWRVLNGRFLRFGRMPPGTPHTLTLIPFEHAASYRGIPVEDGVVKRPDFPLYFDAGAYALEFE